MVRRWLSGLVAGLVMMGALLGVLNPLPANAQDPLTQSYTTSDGRLTVSYPEAWAVTEFFGVLLSNDPALLESLDFDTLPDNVFLLLLVAGPINEVVGLGSDATFEDVLAFAQDEAEDTFVDYIGPKVQEFGGRTAYRTIGKAEGLEAVYMYIDLGDGNLMEVVAFANEGVIQQHGPTIEAVVLSAQYTMPSKPVVSGSVIWQESEVFDYEDYAPIGAVAVGPDDTIFIAGYYSGINVYDTEGNLQEVIGDTPLNNRWSGYAEDFAIAPDGTLWIVDGDQHITHIRRNGEILHAWGELGQDSGEFGEYSPGQVEVSPDGLVITQDRQDTEDYYTLTRIQIWEEDGKLVQEFVPDPPGTATDITGYADIEIAPDGSLYIVGDYDVWRMDLTTGEVNEVVLAPSALSEGYIQGLAVAPNGHLVLVSSAGSFFWYDAQGRYLGQYGQQQASVDFDSDAPRFLDGEFYSPQGVAVLSNGQVVVSDYNYTWWQIVLFTFES